jgi:hypothetical protein
MEWNKDSFLFLFTNRDVGVTHKLRYLTQRHKDTKKREEWSLDMVVGSGIVGRNEEEAKKPQRGKTGQPGVSNLGSMW